jgi:hypothetical protein
MNNEEQIICMMKRKSWQIGYGIFTVSALGFAGYWMMLELIIKQRGKNED